MLLDMKEMSDQWFSYWMLRTATKYIFCPTTPSFSNFPALSLSSYLRKLIHLTFRKNTTPFSPNNPANRLESRFPHEKHGGFCVHCQHEVSIFHSKKSPVYGAALRLLAASPKSSSARQQALLPLSNRPFMFHIFT